MTTFRYESELLAPVAAFLRRQGYYCQLLEVPFYEYRIDIAGYDPAQGQIVAVELKLRRWKRALQQACIYQLLANVAYAAMPRAAAARVSRDELASHGGIGMIAVDDNGECEVVIEAMRSGVTQASYHDSYANMLAEDGSAPRLLKDGTMIKESHRFVLVRTFSPATAFGGNHHPGATECDVQKPCWLMTEPEACRMLKDVKCPDEWEVREIVPRAVKHN